MNLFRLSTRERLNGARVGSSYQRSPPYARGSVSLVGAGANSGKRSAPPLTINRGPAAKNTATRAKVKLVQPARVKDAVQPSPKNAYARSHRTSQFACGDPIGGAGDETHWRPDPIRTGADWLALERAFDRNRRQNRYRRRSSVPRDQCRTGMKCSKTTSFR